ncbi:MAG: hypothetical protein ABIH87_02835 [bacterium]
MDSILLPKGELLNNSIEKLNNNISQIMLVSVSFDNIIIQTKNNNTMFILLKG